MEFEQIRNATVKVHCGDVTLLIDPWLEDRGTGMCAPTDNPAMMGVKSPLCDLPMTPEAVLSGVDACLVTHIHPDHFTAAHMPMDIPVIVKDESDRRRAMAMGFTRVTAMDGAHMQLGGVSITRTIAVHGDSEALAARMGEGTGYLIRAQGRTLYIVGDTVLTEGVLGVMQQARPDALVLNCCAATLPQGRLIMDLDEVAAVCAACPQAMVIASHMDNVNHALLTRADVRQMAKERGIVNLCVPEDGERLVI